MREYANKTLVIRIADEYLYLASMGYIIHPQLAQETRVLRNL